MKKILSNIIIFGALILNLPAKAQVMIDSTKFKDPSHLEMDNTILIQDNELLVEDSIPATTKDINYEDGIALSEYVSTGSLYDRYPEKFELDTFPNGVMYAKPIDSNDSIVGHIKYISPNLEEDGSSSNRPLLCTKKILIQDIFGKADTTMYEFMLSTDTSDIPKVNFRSVRVYESGSRWVDFSEDKVTTLMADIVEEVHQYPQGTVKNMFNDLGHSKEWQDNKQKYQNYEYAYKNDEVSIVQERLSREDRTEIDIEQEYSDDFLLQNTNAVVSLKNIWVTINEPNFDTYMEENGLAAVFNEEARMLYLNGAYFTQESIINFDGIDAVEYLKKDYGLHSTKRTSPLTGKTIVEFKVLRP